MNGNEIVLAVFAALNVLRVAAYIPQIIRIARDEGGAMAISHTTWALFGASHLSTAAYAAFVVNDALMAGVFVVNTVCCAVIVTLTALKRRALRTAGFARVRKPVVP